MQITLDNEEPQTFTIPSLSIENEVDFAGRTHPPDKAYLTGIRRYEFDLPIVLQLHQRVHITVGKFTEWVEVIAVRYAFGGSDPHAYKFRTSLQQNL